MLISAFFPLWEVSIIQLLLNFYCHVPQNAVFHGDVFLFPETLMTAAVISHTFIASFPPLSSFKIILYVLLMTPDVEVCRKSCVWIRWGSLCLSVIKRHGHEWFTVKEQRYKWAPNHFCAKVLTLWLHKCVNCVNTERYAKNAVCCFAHSEDVERFTPSAHGTMAM